MRRTIRAISIIMILIGGFALQLPPINKIGSFSDALSDFDNRLATQKEKGGISERQELLTFLGGQADFVIGEMTIRSRVLAALLILMGALCLIYCWKQKAG